MCNFNGKSPFVATCTLNAIHIFKRERGYYLGDGSRRSMGWIRMDRRALICVNGIPRRILGVGQDDPSDGPRRIEQWAYHGKSYCPLLLGRRIKTIHRMDQDGSLGPENPKGGGALGGVLVHLELN